MRVEVDGEVLDLLPERAVWWPRRRSLLLSDLHLGREETLQHHGLAVPRGVGDDDLDRLDALVARCGATRVLVLGDLVHARSGFGARVRDALAARVAASSAHWTLVAGNHDTASLRAVAACGIEVVEERMVLDPFVLTHDGAGPRTWSGHLHPVVDLGRGRDRLRLPCFVLGPDGHRLPAFTDFAGGATVRPAAGRRIVACAGDRLVDLEGPGDVDAGGPRG